jgi:hypothetical protein
MHSIGAEDLDLDGDLDIIVPKNGGGEGNEWSVFENDGKGNFTQHIVYKGFGGHETIFADFDGDKDIDMVSKCWCKGGAVILLENKLDPAPVNVRDGAFNSNDLKKQLSFKALISQSGEKPELKVFSNVSGKFSIELYDTQGARLASQSGEGGLGTIPMQAFKNGVYLVRLNTSQGSEIQRVVLSR